MTSGLKRKRDKDTEKRPCEDVHSKKAQTAPAAPQMTSSTSDSITLTPMAKNAVTQAAVEYSMDGGKTWTTDNVFKGLDAETKAIVIQDTLSRCKGRTVLLVTHDLSEAEAMSAVKTIMLA